MQCMIIKQTYTCSIDIGESTILPTPLSIVCYMWLLRFFTMVIDFTIVIVVVMIVTIVAIFVIMYVASGIVIVIF